MQERKLYLTTINNKKSSNTFTPLINPKTAGKPTKYQNVLMAFNPYD